MQIPNRIPTPPLATRDGVSPSYLWLPEGRWDNLLDFLLTQFPDVSEQQWHARIAKHEVVDAQGTILAANSAVKRGMCIFYYREIDDEGTIPFQEQILYQDEHLLVVDKPHFLPVIPGGRFLHETLLVRLKKNTGNNQLTPIHRLDRETAGVILFSQKTETRGAYQSLFQQRKVNKTYHALAPHLSQQEFPLTYRSKMIDAEKFFVMEETPGEPNAETQITVIERRGDNDLYELHPSTGKRHQLRVHLASLGAPIINDTFYPITLPCKGDDFSAPLQLLAKSIRFTDPLSGDYRQFTSTKTL